MSHNVLITGGSGYLGGSLLAQLESAQLPHYSQLYALVRTNSQAKLVRQYGATPLTINLSDPSSITTTIVNNKISIVYHLLNAIDISTPAYFIEALGQVKKQTGQEVHFLFTTGAKLFSSHAAAPTHEPLLDTAPYLYNLQKQQRDDAPHAFMRQGAKANNMVIEMAEVHGVRSYIFAPCIVYGKGLGFGNVTSIQTVAVVKAAKALGGMYKVDDGKPSWPVCHVLDNTSLYIEILRAILQGNEIGYGKNGYFLAASGSVAWDDIYGAFGKALKEAGAVDDENVHKADADVLQKMGDALGCPKELIPVQIGGLCTLTAEHGKLIGWMPQFAAEHILHTANEEVGLILSSLKD